MTIRDQIEQRGPAAVAALRQLATEYGDDVLAWAWQRVKARRKRKAKAAISDAADHAREMIRAGSTGAGHE